MTGPSDQLLEMCYGYFRGRALCAAVRVGLPEAIARDPKAIAPLASELDCHADSLYRLLRALASIGVVAESPDGRFGLTELGRPLLKDSPDSVWATVILYVDLIAENWSYLAECVRSGDKANAIAKREGRKLGWATEPDIGAIFQAAMTQGGVDEQALAKACGICDGEVVADLGGGSGGLLAEVLAAHPSCRGVLVDLEAGFDAARLNLAGAGLSDRCQFVVQDLTEGVPVAADVYIMKNVLHAFADEPAMQILRHCRDAMTPRARLLVLEASLPSRISEPDAAVERAAMSDLNMLAVTGGRERGEHEWRALIHAAGLDIASMTPFPDPAFPLAIIRADRPGA